MSSSPSPQSPRSSRSPVGDDLSKQLTLAFAPLHKRAFGVAVGLAIGLGVFAITLIEVLRQPETPSPLRLLAEYFAGYTVSPRGAFIGLLWGFGTGFVMGWFVAFCRNLAVAVSVFWIRTKADLNANRDFLDHI